MEMEKLEKRIGDWASDLGYTLPDGSGVPPKFFTPLVLTPKRRELWEQLIESVQPRKKVEFMRKQLLVLSLKESKQNSKHFDEKQLMSKVILWRKQSLLEKEVKEKKSFILETEKNYISKACALLFEICKIAELEEQCEEYKEKTLVFHLLIRKEKILMDRLEKTMSRVPGAFNPESFLTQQASNLGEELKGTECKNPGPCYDCDFMNKMKYLCKSGVSEECLWEEVMRCKQSLLDKFLEFLEELRTGQKAELREKESGVVELLGSSLTQLKQKIIVKSLQVLLNKMEGQELKAEIDDFEDKMGGVFEGEENGSFSFNDSTSSGTSESGRKEALAKVKELVKSVGMTCYEEYLRSEVARAEDDVRKEKQWEAKAKGKREYQRSLDSIESVAHEILCLIKESKEKKREILECRDRLRTLADNPKDEDVEAAVIRLKAAADRQIQLWMETPASAFGDSGEMGFLPGGKSPGCASGVRFQRFLSAMLLPPVQDARSILEEVEKRKKMAEDAKKFISERMQLSASQAQLLSQATSVKQFGSQSCEKNFKESEAILGKILLRTDELRSRIAFAEKVLKNWIEQPYKHMIMETKMVDVNTTGNE